MGGLVTVGGELFLEMDVRLNRLWSGEWPLVAVGSDTLIKHVVYVLDLNQIRRTGIEH